MDTKTEFFVKLGIAVTVSGTLTAVVYSRSEAVIYFWNCTSSIRGCNLIMAGIFFSISTIGFLALLYIPQALCSIIKFAKGKMGGEKPSQIIAEVAFPPVDNRIGTIGIKNIGNFDVKDCFVDVEKAYWIQHNKDGTTSKGAEKNIRGRLSWLESDLQSIDFKRDIERDSHGVLIKVCEFERDKFVIPFCTKNYVFDSKAQGEVNLLLRIGGVINEKSIPPVFVRSSIEVYPEFSNETGRFIVSGGPGVAMLKGREDFDKWIKALNSIEDRRWFVDDDEEKSIMKEQNKPKILKKRKKGNPHY